MEDVIGIDLGTTNSAVAYWNPQNNMAVVFAITHNQRILPSIVHFGDNGDKVVGSPAKSKIGREGGVTIYQAKRFIGLPFDDVNVQKDISNAAYRVEKAPNSEGVVFPVKAGRVTPEEVGAQVLMKLREIVKSSLGRDVKKAVITIPAYFSEAQRSATRTAGQLAGLEVLHLLHEPTAAAVAFGTEHPAEKDSKLLIFDLGGGTFDVTILYKTDDIFDVRAVGGDTRLGGADFDNIMYQMILEEITKLKGENFKQNALKKPQTVARLRQEAEKLKEMLSQEHSVTTDVQIGTDDIEITVSRDDFESRVKPLFDRCIETVRKTLKDARLAPQDIDKVLLVGGSTLIPMISTLLSREFNGRAPQFAGNPAEVVAVGAAIFGASASSTSPDAPKVALLDVTPRSLGVEIQGFRFSKLIDRNTHIPYSNMGVYQTVSDNQEAICVRIFEGENPLTRDNTLVGELNLKGIPIGRAGAYSFEIEFKLDSDGTLDVVVKCKEKPEVMSKVKLELKKPVNERENDVVARDNAAQFEGNVLYQKLSATFENCKRKTQGIPVSAGFTQAMNETLEFLKANKDSGNKSVPTMKAHQAALDRYFETELADQWDMSEMPQQ